METELPAKLFYKIGKVAALTSLRTSVLRFWETEFSCLKPRKSSSGQRLYSQKDLELVKEIKKLLYTDKLTIEGAKKKLSSTALNIEKKTKSADLPREALVDILSEVKDELQRLSKML